MRGGVRAGALRDVDRKEELCVFWKRILLAATEQRETGSDCTGMASGTPKILTQHQTERQGNPVALSKSVVILILRERTSLSSKMTIFL